MGLDAASGLSDIGIVASGLDLGAGDVNEHVVEGRAGAEPRLQFARRAGFLQAARMEDADPMAERIGLVHEMGRQQNRGTEALRQLGMMAGNLKAHGIDGTTGAIAQMAGRVHLQAQVMAFVDIFYLLTLLFAMLAVFAVIMRKPPASAGGGGGH